MKTVGRALVAAAVGELIVLLIDPLAPGHIFAIAAQPLIFVADLAYLTDSS